MAFEVQQAATSYDVARATFPVKRGERQYSQTLLATLLSDGDGGDVVRSADEAEGANIDGFITADKNEIEEMTESQKKIAVFEVELESENVERALTLVGAVFKR